MAKKLKCWCGIGYVHQLQEKQSYIYVAAYSIADIAAVCKEVGLSPPNYHEIKTYWFDCWGNTMDGIEIERGVWVAKLHHRDAPIRLQSKDKEDNEHISGRSS